MKYVMKGGDENENSNEIMSMAEEMMKEKERESNERNENEMKEIMKW